MADYVAALHAAYLDQAAHLTPGERAELPLISAGDFTVVAAGTRHLHVLATTSPLPAVAAPEVELPGFDRDLHWTLRFYDPVIVPELGLIDESDSARPRDVRSILGIADVVYHVSIAPGGGLSAHHAQHAGTGLANAHAAAIRDFEAMRSAAPAQHELIDELAVALRLGMPRAAELLARSISPSSDAVATTPGTEATALRRAVLDALRQQVGVAR